MAHLSFEYSANLETELDLQAFCDLMRDVMRDSGVFPLGGIRVRGTRVDVCAVASGEPDIAFIDMTVRMGQGRDEATRSEVTETLYAAAETWLRPGSAKHRSRCHWKSWRSMRALPRNGSTACTPF